MWVEYIRGRERESKSERENELYQSKHTRELNNDYTNI